MYEDIELSLHQHTEELARARRTIMELYQKGAGGQVFEIKKLVNYREALFVVLTKRRGAELKIKDRVVVIDKTDGAWLGFFEVSDIGSSEVKAKDYDISPLWLGYIRQSGQTETYAPPGSIAISMSKDGGDYD